MGTKVLHILNTAKFSGAENVVITIIESFGKLSEDTEFIYVSPEGSIRDILKEKNINYEPVRAISVSELRRVIKKYKPDIIHAHDFTASIIAAVSAGKIPVISHIHNNSPWLKKYCLNSFVYGISCIKYKNIIGVSNSVFSEYVFGRFIRKKASVIGNPIDTSKVIELAEKSATEEKYDVCFLGRLCGPKDPVRFIDIVKKLNEKVPVKAVMMGDGPYRKTVENKILEYGLEEKVIVKGFVKNPYGILKNSKVLCAPSKWEGYGLMAVEALSLGVPVVAAPVGGLVDIVTDECGALCQTNEDYISSIYNLLTNNTFYAEIFAGAFNRAAELDNIKDYCYNLMKLYKK